MQFADLQDVKDRYPGAWDTSRDPWVTALVSDANLLLSRRILDLPDRASNEPELAELAKIVVVNSVIRVVSNPTGVTQETFGSYSYSRPAGQNVWFRDDELAMLTNPDDLAPVRSVQMILPPHRQAGPPPRIPDTEWAPVNYYY